MEERRRSLSYKIATSEELEMASRNSGPNNNENGNRKWWISRFLQRQKLRHIVNDMTWHGVSHVTNTDRAPWDRLLWLVAMLVCVCVFFYMLYGLLVAYYDYPFTTVVASTPTDTLPFPALSLCNINTMDISNVSYSDVLSEIMSWTAFGDFDISAHQVTSRHWNVLNMPAQKILEDTDRGISYTLNSCFYDNVKRDCNELFDVTVWAMTRCYVLNVSKLHLASASTNLRVVVDVNRYGYVVQEDKSVGVKFFVHSAGDIPNFSTQSSIAAPGFTTNVGLQYNELKMLEYPYKSYKNRYCTTSDDLDPTGEAGGGGGDGRPYLLMPCLKAKALHLAHTNCNCRTPFDVTEPGKADCTLHQMLTCVMPLVDNIISHVYNASDELGCPLPCDEVNYVTSVTFSYFPSPQSEAMLKDKGVIRNDSYVRENVLELNFFYTDLIRFSVEYVPGFSVMTILGVIGGNLALLLGASVLSVLELAELIVVAIHRAVQSLRTRRQTSETTSRPE